MSPPPDCCLAPCFWGAFPLVRALPLGGALPLVRALPLARAPPFVLSQALCCSVSLMKPPLFAHPPLPAAPPGAAMPFCFLDLVLRCFDPYSRPHSGTSLSVAPTGGYVDVEDEEFVRDARCVHTNQSRVLIDA